MIKYNISDIMDFCEDMADSMDATFVNYDALWDYSESLIGDQKTFTAEEYDSICYDIENYAYNFIFEEEG